MATNETFWGNIYVGLKNTDTGDLIVPSVVFDACRSYCNEKGFCVSITPTTFVYTNGEEPGLIIGIINYPRFPAAIIELKHAALTLAAMVKKAAYQKRVSVVFPDETVMLGEDK